MAEGTYWSRGITGRTSRRGLLRGGALAGAGLAGAALLGCGSDDDDAPPPAAATPAPGTPAPPDPADDSRRGGKIGIWAINPGDSFNTVVNWTEGNHLSGVHVYDRPFSPRPDDRVMVLEAAESVEVPDDTTVIITLKEGLVYQDRPPINGRPVEAEDIVEMHHYVRGEDQAHNPGFQRNIMDTVEATDDRTIVFTLQQPSAYLFSSFELGNAANTGIIPRELVTGDFENTEPVGSGPWQVKAIQRGVLYEYERNPTYRDADQGLPYVDERSRIVLPDVAAQETAFRAEQSMVYIPPPDVADRIVRDLSDRIEVTEFLTFSPFTRHMSSKRPHFDDIRVREAFYRAFNADEHIDLVLNGWGVAVPGIAPASWTDYQLDWDETLASGKTVAEHQKHDPEEARQLLEAAGFNFDQEYVLSAPAVGVNDQTLQVFGEQIRRVGVTNTTFDIRPLAEWFSAQSNTGNHDFGTMNHPSEDSLSRVLRLNHSNTGMIHQSKNIADPEVDALIDEADIQIDREAHVEKVKEVQRALLERYAHMGLVFTQINRELMWSYIQDWEFVAVTVPVYQQQAWLDV
jgi:peptide/nickel transport system substrate-binding protein